MTAFSGSLAIVTGASRGIGRAIAEEFHRRGARVLGCSRPPRPEGLPGPVEWMAVDVGRTTDIEALHARVLELQESNWILVNNAGIQFDKPIFATTDSEWTMCVDINCRGVFNTCRAFLPGMMSQGGGTIINIGSVAADRADSSLPLYNATKGFVHALTRSIATDYGPMVRCNAVSPGWIETGMLDDAFSLSDSPELARRDAVERHPVKRFGTPADVAKAVCWLASEDATFVNGECLRVDGGLSAASSIRPELSGKPKP